jgi:hypothetical protein
VEAIFIDAKNAGLAAASLVGAVKDAGYGKINGEVSNQDYYNKAQLVVAAMDQYARSVLLFTVAFSVL